MEAPPIPIDELRPRLHTAIREMGNEQSAGILDQLKGEMPAWLAAHYRMEHSYPSPSTIMNCRLQQWYGAKGVEPDQVHSTVPAWSVIVPPDVRMKSA